LHWSPIDDRIPKTEMSNHQSLNDMVFSTQKLKKTCLKWVVESGSRQDYWNIIT